MRNTLPLLSRAPAPNSSLPRPPSPKPSSKPKLVPTIRLISATPSATGSASDANMSFANGSIASVTPFSSSPLAPRTEAEPTRKRLVPKKSKLGLLGGNGKTKEKASKDFSDVDRRVGGSPSTGRGGFEIYVDHSEDPDLGEIVVVKKKKSRMGLDGMKWGALGEVTNIPSAPKENRPTPVEHLKVKGDENQKWWSIGRGRKDSKEKAKEKGRDKSQARSKTPEPFKPLDSRARFNSLDSGILLSAPADRVNNKGTVSSVQNLLTVPRLASDPITSAEPPSIDSNHLAPNPPAAGSIAVRAIRSMRSLARMASWNQLSHPDKEDGAAPPIETTVKTKKEKSKEKAKGEGKKKKKKEKDKTKEKGNDKEAKEKTLRYSGSSFEAGALSVHGHPPPMQNNEPSKTLGKKKQSILGLGLPSTTRFATTVRNTTSSSTASANLPVANRLSVDSSHLTMNANGRPSSILSNGSSLRPPSTASGVSAFSGRSPRSSSSSIASVRWDEVGLQSVKEMQRKERRSRREKDRKSTRDNRESRRSSEGRRRTPIAEIFPETQLQRPASLSPPTSVHEQPIVMIEEATVDGHSDPRDEDHGARVSGSGETPVKRARPRPMSEQMLGRTRPRAICEDEDGVLSILDAVTNDLASLINRLDLEATPANSPANASPLKLSSFSQGDESPIKKRVFAKDTPLKVELRESMASISSLRPYVHAQAIRQQAQKTAHLVGQQIVPWDSLSWQISPKKPTTTSSTAHLSRKRSMTPVPATEPIPVFHPLRPAKSRTAPVTSASPASSVVTLSCNKGGVGTPSSRTFGSKTSLRSSQALEPSSCPSPVFSRIGGHVRKSSSLIPISDNESRRRSDQSMPLSREAKQGLGLCGTLGRSTEPPVDTEDPDSDIPDELQGILTSQADDDTLSYKPLQNPPSPGSPPALPLPLLEATNKSLVLPDIPVFQLFDEEANQADIDEGGNASSEDDTKKSFDFTGELKKLNESGASDRRSFVEQLENAFRTPAKIGLGFGLSDRLGFNGEFLVVPPVPPLPASLRQPPAEDVAPRSVSILSDGPSFFNASASPAYNDSGVSEEPSFIMDFNVEDECRVYTELKNSVSVGSKPSDGQLNIDFKFGGKPAVSEAVEVSKKPLTLSDIIPPLSHSRSSSRSFAVEEDSSVLKSILAKAVDMPPPAPRSRLDSDSSSKRYAREVIRAEQSAMSPSRPASGVSFLGFDSFDEVRRGFEFGPNRPAFYPPPAARPSHTREVSLFSIASISSYGAVLDSGSVDPFGYDWSRPSSEDMSMSMSTSVDDTFAFMHKDGGRQRVDSDASSFYFRSPGASHTMHPYRRGHQRHSPAVSVASNVPPVSLYNRSFAGHRRNDSGTSGSSVTHSYAMYGASGGRAAWTQHRHDYSVDSMMSDYSAQRLGRPGLGDKMFDNDHGTPLEAISASPGSDSGGMRNDRTSWDSIMDDQVSTVEDSLFDKTGYKRSISSANLFELDDSNLQRGTQFLSRQFRPISMMSEKSVHSSVKEDDTMITMLDGGHVRRRSIGSLIDASPCVRVEKTKHSAVQLPSAVLRFDLGEADAVDSPNKSRLIEKPSIASTSSHQFGGERMIMARKGLLERQSLEESALIAHGEDVLAALREQSIFNRPAPASRSRSSTCTSSSSGAETPPLSSSDGFSMSSSGSESSIDISHLSTLLANTSRPSSGVAWARARARARGTGHRRRITQARASRSSVYETIQEEGSVLSSSPSFEQATVHTSVKSDLAPAVDGSVFIVGSDSESVSDWDDQRGITNLRRYYALRDEAHETVQESKRAWVDTPFSIFAVQSFQPPTNPSGMQAMLEHSQKNYGPLPSELRPRRVRSRTSSRASPYPVRNVRSSMSPEQVRVSPMLVNGNKPSAMSPRPEMALRDVSRNININAPSPPALDTIKLCSPFNVELDKSKQGRTGQGFPARPRVTSSARRSALGWSKRSTGKSSSQDCKENIAQGMLITASDSLRINRPRPRGRPMPYRAAVPVA